MTEASQVQNLEVTILGLRQEANQVSKELASGYVERDSLIEERNNIKELIENEKNYLILLKTKYSEEEDKIEAKRCVLREEQFEHKLKLEEIENDGKKAKKELNKLNLWIVDAKKEEEIYKNKLKELEDIISTKEQLVEKIFELQNEIIDLKTEKNLVLANQTILIKQKKDELLFLNTDLEKLKKEVEVLKNEAEQALNRRTRFDNEYIEKKKDLDIYYTRIQKEYKKVFPNKEMPMKKT